MRTFLQRKRLAPSDHLHGSCNIVGFFIFNVNGEWIGVSTVEAGRQALERGEFRQAVWEATSIKSAIEEEECQ